MKIVEIISTYERRKFMGQWKKPEILAEFQITDILTPELLSDWKQSSLQWKEVWKKSL